MDPIKKEYVQRVRGNSAYPAFRSWIQVFTIFFYVLGTLQILGGLIIGSIIFSAFGNAQSGIIAFLWILGGLTVGSVSLLCGKLFKEMSLMIADIADSLLELNSRHDQ